VPWKLKHFYYLIILLFIVLCLCVYFADYVINDNMNSICKLSAMGFLVIATFRADEMLVDRLFYYFILPILYVGYDTFRFVMLKKLKAPAVFLILFLIAGSVWSLKSNYQFYTWFVTKKSIK